MIVITAMLIMGATVIVTPGMAALAEDARLALRRTGIDAKEAAALIHASPQRLSDQLLGKEAFTLFCRFADLPVDFWAEFSALRAKRRGVPVLTLDDMQAAIAKLDRLIETFAMAKMDLLPSASEQEKTA